MRVLHVIDSLGVGGGAEHSLVAMLPEIEARGVENEVVCLVDRQSGLFEELARMGIPYSVAAGKNHIQQLLSLRRLVKKRAPDIVHASLVKSSILSRIACVGLRVPQINSLVNTTYDPVRVAELGAASWKIASMKAVDRATSRQVTRFHALTESVKREAIAKLAIPPERIVVIPRGRSLDKLGRRSEKRRQEVRTQLGLNPDQFVYLNVARQDSQKAQDVLIAAFDIVAGRDHEATLLIAGRPGNASDAVTAALENATHSSRIRLLGHRDDVPDLLAAADVFVLSSRYEGFGGVLLEAMALECPIVGTDAPAVREVLANGELGLITQGGRSEDLSLAMEQMASDPALRSLLAKSAYRHCIENYDLGRVCERLVSLYNEVAGSSDSGM